MDPLLRIINLSKAFGDLWALQNVSLDVSAGEVVGIAGSSGAGKSVLAKILAGLIEPTQGDIYFGERRYRALLPYISHDLGIHILHQKPEMVDQLDITANIFLGHEHASGPFGALIRWADRHRMDELALKALDQLGVRFTSLHEKAANLSGEERQIVAIAQAMIFPARLRVVDGPLVGLNLPLQKKLLACIQQWQAQGCAVLLCSDNLDDLFAVCDHIVVLNKGRKVATRRTDRTTQEEIVSLMVGTPPPDQVTPIIWALDSYYRAREQAETLQQNQALLQQDLAAQDSLNKQLLSQLAEQLAALNQANNALQDAQRRLLQEREQERKHLARELHDQIIQDLLGLGYRLEALMNEQGISSALALSLETIRDDVRQLVADLRQICSDLRPPALDSLGLGAAIASYAQEWAERSGIKLVLNIDPQLGRLPEAIELSIFRIVQEGLNNIYQHALASEATVTLHHITPRTLQIIISDNGKGLDPRLDLAKLAASKHFGLLGISERVALMGGKLQLQNQPGGGLAIQVEIPHPRVSGPAYGENLP